MSESNESCYLDQQHDETIIVLNNKINITHSENLKALLLEAIELNQPIRIDLSELYELDVTTMQLIYASKRSADEAELTFNISPIHEKVKKIIDASHMFTELMPS